jgi:dehydrogenase/reductase SDR family protein 4
LGLKWVDIILELIVNATESGLICPACTGAWGPARYREEVTVAVWYYERGGQQTMSQRESFWGRFSLSGKVALVTGGSRGIGRAIALGFAEAGADIILASRKLPDLEGVAREITLLGRRALPVVANLRRASEIDGLVKKALEEFDHIDILVNNAATNLGYNSVFDIDEKFWDVVMGLNLKGCFFLSQTVGRIMRDRGGGNIINVASQAGIRPTLGLGVYSISKAGLIMLTQVLAQEWGQYNIRVNTIAPGTVKTKFSEVRWKDPEISRMIKNDLALKRIGEPEEMVNAAIYLASDASSYVTGQTILLDGGHFASVGSLLSTLPHG